MKNNIMGTMAALLGLTVLCQLASAVSTNYYYVSAAGSGELPFDTWGKATNSIQAAVDKAQADFVPGSVECVVWVSNGTYRVTTPVTLTKAITLAGYSGNAADTIIAGGYPASSNRCLVVAGDAWVTGLTISNGFAYGEAPNNQGGGIYMTTNGAGRGGLVSNCRIVKNQARLSPSALNGMGCGIYVNRSGIVSNCLIQGNSSDKAHGAGVYLYYGGRVVGCQILDNTGNTGATTYGGGVYLNTAGEVVDCLVARNETRHAGGLFLDGGGEAARCTISNNFGGNSKGVAMSSGTLRECIIERNVSGYTSGSGGGITVSGGGVVDRCTIRYNMSSSAAGVSLDRSTLRNSLIYGNQAANAGGGVVGSSFVNTTIENCTIVQNAAGTNGGGIVVGTASSAPYGGDIRNVICVDNTCTAGTDNVSFVPYAGYDITNNNRFVYSCVTPALPGASNIVSAPLFVAPGLNAGTNATAGDYRLQAGSPCQGAGTNVAWMASGFDLAGANRLRPSWGRVDMGAYESVPSAGALTNSFTAVPGVGASPLIVSFAGEVSGNTNGILYRWSFGDGTTNDWSPDTLSTTHTYAARTNAYTVIMGVSNAAGESASRTLLNAVMVYPPIVYVATNGTHSPPFDTWGTAATNIQAAVDVAGVGWSSVLVSNGVYVVRTNLLISKAIAVRASSTNWVDTVIQGTYPASTNRCVFITAAGALLEGFTITGGRAPSSQHGGGIHMTAASTIRNCLIIRNSSAYDSGGVYLNAGLIENCWILSNTNTTQVGAGAYVDGAIISNCVVANNTSLSTIGGGVALANGALMVNCLVSNNTGRSGGGIYHQAGGITVSGSVIVNNTASGNGGGVGTPATPVGAGVFRNCLIAGNAAGTNGGGVFFVSTAERFENCTLANNKAGSGGGWYQGLAGTGVNCIVWGNEATNASAAEADIAGSPTATNTQGAVVTNFLNSCSPTLAGSGNTAANPRFARAGAGAGQDAVLGDYRVRAGSPCEDSGVWLPWMAGAVDLAGSNRVQGAAVNMGAYETVLLTRRGGLLLIR